MVLTAPTALANDTPSPVPILTVTRFGIVWPVPKFRFEALGTLPPVGNRVRNDGLVPPVTVVFMTAAVASLGTPTVVPTVSDFGVPALTAPLNPPNVDRESRMRVGDVAWKRAPPPGSKYPTTSTMT